MKFGPFLIVALAVLACTPNQKDPGGTAVGNPGEATMRMGDNEDFIWNDASATLNELIVTDCAGEAEVVDLDEEFSFLGEDSIPIPPGTHCEINLIFDGFLQVNGGPNPDTTFTMDLAIPDDTLTIISSSGLKIDETITVLEISSPNLLTIEDLDLTDGEETLYDENNALSVFYANTVAARSALWLDVDTDGEVSESERQTGPISAGEEWEPEEEDEDDEGQGCGGDGEEGWLFLALTPLLFRRREWSRRPDST